MTTARTFDDVVRDWENGLEPYKSADPSSDIYSGLSGMIAPVAVRLGKLLGLADFFSLKVRPEFIRKVIAVAVFWYFFACLPPPNTGDENPNGYYVHNFITNTVEYRINGKGVLLYK